jgi:hypothetical protein
MKLLKSHVPFSEESKQQLVSSCTRIHGQAARLQRMERKFFLIVFIFNLIVGVAVPALDGDDTLICSCDKPAVTRC